MPNYKYEEFRRQIYREFEQGNRPQSIIEQYQLTNRSNIEQNLPTRNVVYKWHKDYIIQHSSDKSKLEGLQTEKEMWWKDKAPQEGKTQKEESKQDLQLVNIDKNEGKSGRETTRRSGGSSDEWLIGGAVGVCAIIALLLLGKK